MILLRRYHRVVRALLFVVVLFAIFAVWLSAVDPRLLDLSTFWQFSTTFILIGTAAFVTHRVGPWVAPAAKGQVDEDDETVIIEPNKPDVE